MLKCSTLLVLKTFKKYLVFFGSIFPENYKAPQARKALPE
jgi:hypothetical protein